MGGDGEFADEKGIGDFSGGTTLSHKFGDLFFPVAEEM
jgi:hypothetical protein